VAFVLSKLFWILAQPGNLLLAALVGGSLLGRRFRLGRALAAAAAALLLAVAVLPVGEWALRPLEERFPRPELPARVDGIVVLGGMVDQVVAHHRGAPALTDAAERLVEFADLARRFPEARLVATGGSGRLDEQDLKEAPVMEEALRRMGFDASRVLFEDRSRNTHENVLYSRDLVGPRPGETWVVVTSASHLPRSVGIFRRAGWPVLGWPADYRTGAGRGVGTPSLSGNLAMLDFAAREWLGLLAYRLMGRTDALLPAP
jgi:uncharacterized SAM-binding protein YcdF (DUF218 family)